MPGIHIECEETACLICGADNPRQLFEMTDRLCHVPGVYRIVRCRHCGHVYMNPRPVKESVKDCYPSDYGPYQPTGTEAGSESSVSTEKQEQHDLSRTPWYLSRWARAIPGLRAFYYWLTDSKSELIPTRAEVSCSERTPQGLELGCSHGRFLDKLLSQGWQASGVELSDQAAAIARGNGHHVITGTLESAHFEEEQFDAVFSWMVIEHLVEPRSELTEIRRILKPSGLLLFSIPNSGCWEPCFFRSYWYAYEVPRHLNYFTTRSIRRLLKECGFETVKIIHQRNVLYLIASVGLFLREATPFHAIGNRLVQFTDNPTMWPQILLAPIAKLLAWFRQGGRITIVARRNR